jgi:hypothetical protein
MRVPQVSERIKEAPAQALRGVFAGIGQLLLITDKLRNKAPAGQDVSRARTSGASGTVTATTAARPAGQREEAAAAPATPAATEPVASATAPAATAAADEAAAAKSVAAEPVAAESAAAKSAAARRAPAKPTTAKPATKPTGKPTTARRSPARPATAKAAPAEPAAGEPPKPPKRQSTRDFDKTGNVRLLGEEDSSPLSAAASAIQAEPVTTPEPVTAAEPEAVTAAEPEAVTAAEPVSGPADSAPPLPNYDELSVASLRARLRNLDVAQVAQLADYERAHAARADVLAMFERRIAKLEAEA